MARTPFEDSGGPRRSSGHRWELFKQLMFRTYGDTCHICHHGGARQADHLDPVTEDAAREYDLANIRPAHGAPGNACAQCSAACGRRIFCNQVRGMGSVDRARRLIAGWAAGNAEKGAAASGTRPQPDPGAGRPW